MFDDERHAAQPRTLFMRNYPSEEVIVIGDSKADFSPPWVKLGKAATDRRILAGQQDPASATRDTRGEADVTY